MNKQQIINLLKASDSGSDELNNAYYAWKYPDWSVACEDGFMFQETGRYLKIQDVSRSVDAALGEIPKEHGYWLEHEEMMNGEWWYEACIRTEDDRLYGKHKLLTHAILLAVVEAAP